MRILLGLIVFALITTSLALMRNYACKYQEQAFWVGFAIPIGGCR